ncbi:hypothetical protein D2T31_11850 [Sinirhodobacter populi]|uniref:Uncharacterized protein n=1 Tax=Paenirhodobacter populi TaxID=2306993 RepID=A0A443K7U9_9RHOB|nr:hypothetical protein [Sinirhodobacter populi]RWR28800.1 hypothetical protein D2T31_11850 [Sinirhodobacter populi]
MRDYVQVLMQGTRKARKPHQCFHCYRTIAPGEAYGFQNNVYDNRAYTLRWHLDCEECANETRNVSDLYGDEGFGPLRDEWCNSGEYDAECNNWRGFFPHVVARMELTDQLRAARAAQKQEGRDDG